MSSYWGILLAIVLILIWIVAGGYITQANIKIRGFEGNDEFFRKANNYTFWASFITWFLVALFILLIILAIVGVVGLFSTGAGEAEVAAEEEESVGSKLYNQYQKLPSDNNQGGVSWSTIIFLVFAMILVGITGVLAALAAENLKQSQLYNESNADMVTAYNNCVITAILCLGTDSLIILGIIFYLFIGFFESRQSTPTMSVNNTVPSITPVNNINTIPSITPVNTIPSITPVNNNIPLINNVPALTADQQQELARLFYTGKIVK